MFNTTHTVPAFLKHIATYKIPYIREWHKISQVFNWQSRKMDEIIQRIN
jgi:hypothetical protein